MATVTVEVNGRPYAVGCADGQEERVRILAKQFDNQVRAVAQDVGQVGDLRLFLMSALILADELHEARLGGGKAPVAAAPAPAATDGVAEAPERRRRPDREDRSKYLTSRRWRVRAQGPILSGGGSCCGSRRRQHILLTLIHSTGSVPVRARGPGAYGAHLATQVERI